MPTPDPRSAGVALNRFGFGAKPGDLVKALADARGFLKAQLRVPDAALIDRTDPANADLLGTTVAIEASMAANMQRQQQRAAASPAPPAATGPAMAPAAMAPAMAEPPTPMAAMAKPKAEPSVEQKLFRSEARARFDKAVSADTGFVERLVAFWSNHFCVSVAKDNLVRATAGAFEREAIRPFVLGRFADMLFAVEHHPAMLYFLDNQQSIGPESRAGQNRKRGLNENLAREIIELHTLGVDGDYSQSDVTTFARVLTGWTVAGREGRQGEPGAFFFNANAHEPGDAVLLGKSYAGGGIGQAEAVLTELAHHPATARHLATKLVRHFLADEPPEGAVARLAKVFLDTGGDLRATANALIDLPESWSSLPTKLRTPYEFLVAIRRATGAETVADVGPLLNGLNALGEPLWQPPSPNGFSDLASSQASPEGMKMRLDIAAQAARQVKALGNPSDLVDTILGPSASAETRHAVAAAESKPQGLALLLMSPEFQRR
jgi:uncharacterized protein (DUF1800 family)